MLFSWMKELILYMLLSSIVTNMSPGKDYKKYISFFSGLVVILILAEPARFLLGAVNGNLNIFTGTVDEYLMYNYELSNVGSIYDYYDMSLEESIKHFLTDRGNEVEKISVITDDKDQIIDLHIYLKEKRREASIEEIKKSVEEVYNIDSDSIYVIRR